jgi:hypothetical protein
MTSSEVESTLERTREAAVAALDAMAVELSRKLFLSVSCEQLQQPEVRRRVDEMHGRILRWHNTQIAAIESVRLGAAGRLN